MFGHEVPTVCGAWLRMAKYNDQYSQSKCAWVNEQHEVILAVNGLTLKTSSKLPKRQQCMQEVTLSIYPKIIWVHWGIILKVVTKFSITINLNYSSLWWSMRTLCLHNPSTVWGSGAMVNWWQLFHLEKSSLGDSEDSDLVDLPPKTKLPNTGQRKLIPISLPISIIRVPDPRLGSALYHNFKLQMNIVICRMGLD